MVLSADALLELSSSLQTLISIYLPSLSLSQMRHSRSCPGAKASPCRRLAPPGTIRIMHKRKILVSLCHLHRVLHRSTQATWYADAELGKPYRLSSR